MSKTRTVVLKGNVNKGDGSEEIRNVGVDENETLVLNGDPVEITEEQFTSLSTRSILETLTKKEAQKITEDRSPGDATIPGSQESHEPEKDNK